METARTKIENAELWKIKTLKAFRNEILYYDFIWTFDICIRQFSKFKSKVNSVNLNKFHLSILFETTKQNWHAQLRSFSFHSNPLYKIDNFKTCQNFFHPSRLKWRKTNWTRDNSCDCEDMYCTVILLIGVFKCFPNSTLEIWMFFPKTYKSGSQWRSLRISVLF